MLNEMGQKYEGMIWVKAIVREMVPVCERVVTQE